MRLLRLIALLATATFAQTYYIANAPLGSDANDGLQKTNDGAGHGPWEHAPGMQNATGTPAAFTNGVGNTFVFRGCDVWPWASFPFFIARDNGAGVPGYYGQPTSEGQRITFTVDNTWYNHTNCPSGWNRPIFDGCKVSAAPSANRPTCTGSNLAEITAMAGWEDDMVVLQPNYVTFDNFEIRNHYTKNCGGAGTCEKGTGQGIAIAGGGQSSDHAIISNNYYHAFINEPAFVATCTVANGSSTVTCPSTTGARVGMKFQLNGNASTVMPNPNNQITAVTNSTTLSMTFTAQNGDCAAGCLVQGGNDFGAFIATSIWPNVKFSAAIGNVFDGTDTDPVQDDSGANRGTGAWHCSTTGSGDYSDQFTKCLGSRIAFFGIPIVRNNFVQQAMNFYVGSASEFSGNTFLYGRASIDPTQHENFFENNADPTTGLQAFNNVFGHVLKGVPWWVAPIGQFSTTGSIGAGSHTLTIASISACGASPCGFDPLVPVRVTLDNAAKFESVITAGWGTTTLTLADAAPSAATNGVVLSGGLNPTYLWNNVYFDGLANTVFETAANLSYPTHNGTVYLWNNTAEGGPNAVPNFDFTTAPVTYDHVYVQNNHIVTSGNTTTLCGANCTADHNLKQLLATATAAGHYTTFDTTFAFSPGASADGIGQGSNLTASCAITGLSSLCTDATYGVGYDTNTNAVVIPGRAGNARPNAAWDNGAYFYSAGAAATAALTATPAVIKLGTSSTLASTCTNSASASIDNGIGAVSATTANTSVSPTTATTYTLTCTPSAGSAATGTATVTVGGIVQRANTTRTANMVMQKLRCLVKGKKCYV